MRKDLGKVLTEPGKVGPEHDYGTQHRRRNLKEDQLPSKEGLRKGLMGQGRYSNATRNPLRNMLEKAIGKVWDKFYNEIKTSLNSNNHEQMSMLELFARYDIETKVQEIVKVGKIKVPHDLENRPVYDKIWVHPKTGRIMKAVRRVDGPPVPHYPKYIQIKGKSYRVLYSAKVVEAVEEGEMDADDAIGNWFEVTLEPIPGDIDGWGTRGRFIVDKDFVMPVDVVSGVTATLQDSHQLHDGRFVATAKRQLSGREIKKLGLADKFAGVKPKKRSPHERERVF